MTIWELIIPICPVILLHIFFLRKMRHIGEYGKQAVLWSADLVAALILLFLAICNFDYTPDGKELFHNMWLVLAGLFSTGVLFLIGPSGIRLLKYRKKEDTMETEEYSFNQVAAAIRNFCYITLFIFTAVTLIRTGESKTDQLYVQGILGICSVILPALCLRQTCYWLKMVTFDIRNHDKLKERVDKT